MYCVVQTIQRKKPNTSGEYREYEVNSMTIQFQDGRSKTHYSYYPKYEAGRFDRPHLEAFKISIHESHRENGRVVKRQCVLGTVGYYELLQWGLCDYLERGMDRAVDMFGADYKELYRLVEAKMQTIIDRITKEFHNTEEYKAKQQREKVEKAHQKAKKKFGKQYEVDPDEYDYCFNIFGELMDKAYFDQIVRQYEQKQNARRSYQESRRSTYEGFTGGSYSFSFASTYTEDESETLRRFYRVLAKKFHPDVNPGTDTTKQMQLLNRLKESWGI